MRFLGVLLLLVVGCDSTVLVTGRPEVPDTTVVVETCRECRDDCLEAFPPARDPVGFQDCYRACKEGACG